MSQRYSPGASSGLGSESAAVASAFSVQKERWIDLFMRRAITFIVSVHPRPQAKVNVICFGMITSLHNDM